MKWGKHNPNIQLKILNSNYPQASELYSASALPVAWESDRSGPKPHGSETKTSKLCSRLTRDICRARNEEQKMVIDLFPIFLNLPEIHLTIDATHRAEVNFREI